LGAIVSNLLIEKVELAEGFLYLVEIFNLIEFFGVASLFGWFTFARLTDEEIEKIQGKKKQKVARNNLLAITNYFLISFAFYSVAGITDYLYHHKGQPYAALMPEMVLFRATLVLFVLGTLVLVIPFAIVSSIPRFGRNLGDIHPAPFDYTVALFSFSAFMSITGWSQPLYGPMADWAKLPTFISGFLPLAGLFVGLWYYWTGKPEPKMNRKVVVVNFLVLILAPFWIAIAIALISLIGY
jgi:hypothetical protein